MENKYRVGTTAESATEAAVKWRFAGGADAKPFALK
jgi:hypothetical protein